MDDKHFDEKIALEWINIIENPNASVREIDIYPLLESWLSQSLVNKVLDIGCGQGACSIHLGKNQFEYVGIDPSPQLIQRAIELYKNTTRTFMAGNAYDLPFFNKHFDAVFSIAVWHLLSDISRAANELSRVLKDNGRILIITADPAQYNTWLENYENMTHNGYKFIGSNRNADGSITSDTLYLHPLDEIIESFEKQNIKILKTHKLRSFIAISGIKCTYE